MPEQVLPPTIFHMLEKNLGKKIRVILDPSYGFEGKLAAVTRERSEVFVHLNSVQRIEVLHVSPRR
jgi:transcription antitermination factor NusG